MKKIKLDWESSFHLESDLNYLNFLNKKIDRKLKSIRWFVEKETDKETVLDIIDSLFETVDCSIFWTNQAMKLLGFDKESEIDNERK